MENGQTLLIKMSVAAAQFASTDPNIRYLLHKEYLRVNTETLERYRHSGSPMKRFYTSHLRDTFGNTLDSRETMYDMIIDFVKDRNYVIDVEFEAREFMAPLARSITIRMGGKTYKTTLRAKSIKLIKE